ncbi:MAG TPA: VanZ family protein [Vicinamibacterales bacterium]
MRRVFLWLPAVLYMALIFYSSSQSDPVPALTHAVWDKLLHCGGYAVLGVFFALALRGEGLSLGRTLVLAIVLTSVYGASDEYHQRFTPQRQSDIDDWLADSIGGTAGAAAFAAVLKVKANQ